jgi:hypothetical protein
MHRIALFLAIAATSASAQAAPLDWRAVDDGVLDRLRGGIDTGQGLMVSIGVERLVSINGNTVASASFSVGAVPSPYTLVQNGAGNLAQPGAMPDAIAGLVLQNSLNDQLLRSQTTINASVNSLSALRDINFEGSLRQALAYGVGTR